MPVSRAVAPPPTATVPEARSPIVPERTIVPGPSRARLDPAVPERPIVPESASAAPEPAAKTVLPPSEMPPA